MDIVDYINSNGIGSEREKQTPENWGDYYTTYRATRDSYSKSIPEYLTAYTDCQILWNSSCKTYIAKLVSTLTKEMSEADKWAQIHFNSLLGEDKQTGVQPFETTWNYDLVESEELEIIGTTFVTVSGIPPAEDTIDYGTGEYDVNNWNNFVRLYKQGHCTLKKLCNYVHGLSTPEGYATPVSKVGDATGICAAGPAEA